MDETTRCMTSVRGSNRLTLRRSAVYALLGMGGALCGVNGVAAQVAQPVPAPSAVPAQAQVSASAPAVALPVSAPASSPSAIAAELPPPVPAVTIVSPPVPASVPVAVSPPPPPAASVAPPVSSAPGWSPVFTGSYFTRYELRSGYDDLGLTTNRARFLDGDAFFYRLRFGIGTGLIDLGSRLKVGLQFTPQATGTFGNLTTSPSAPNTIIDANIGLHEGYGRVQGQYVRFDAGRFELNYGDALVIGNLDWNEVGRSFDGVRARFATSPTSVWFDVFATVLDEGRPDVPRGGALDNSAGIGLGDTYFVGGYAALGAAITKGLDLDLYALARIWTDADKLRVTPADAMSPVYRRSDASEGTFGLRTKQKLGFFDYRFEGGIQAGSRPGVTPTLKTLPPGNYLDEVSVFAYQGDLELGVSFMQEKMRLSLEGLYASGDDPKTVGKNEGWNELFPTAHKFLGLTDAFVQAGQKRTNVASGVAHATASPMKNLTVQVDGHLFARPERSVVGGKKGMAGSEIDVAASYVLAKGLKVRGVYGAFLPTEHLYDDVLPMNKALARGVDPVQFFELELRYDLMP